MTGVQTCALPISRFKEVFHADFETVYHKALQKNIERGMLQIANGHVRTTWEGLLLLHDVLIDFLPEEAL